MFYIYFISYIFLLSTLASASDDLDSPRHWVWNSAVETPLNISMDFNTDIEGNRIIAPIDQLKNIIRNIEQFEGRNSTEKISILSNNTLQLAGAEMNFTLYEPFGNYAESDTLMQKQVFSVSFPKNVEKEYFLFQPAANSTHLMETIALRIRCTVETTKFKCFVAKEAKPDSANWTVWLLIILSVFLVLIVVFLCARQCCTKATLRNCQRPEASARYTVNA